MIRGGDSLMTGSIFRILYLKFKRNNTQRNPKIVNIKMMETISKLKLMTKPNKMRVLVIVAFMMNTMTMVIMMKTKVSRKGFDFL